jgi:aminoglycoside/choline kinase family phosphotransferase
MGSKGMTEGEIESGADDEEIPFISAEPNPFWKKNAEKLVSESIPVVEDTVKQFVAVTGLLQGIYSHAIAFSDIDKQLVFNPDISGSACAVVDEPDFCDNGALQEKV